MSKSPKSRKAPRPSTEAVVEENGDYTIIRPKHNLRSFAHKVSAGKTTPLDDDGLDPELLARAEAALAEMAGEFDAMLDSEVSRLTAAFTAAKSSTYASNDRQELYLAAHDIKGDAATFGYPLAGLVAKSLCKALDMIEPADLLPTPLLAGHVDAIRAIAREKASGDNNLVARALADELIRVTDDAIIRITGLPVVPEAETPSIADGASQG